jgi:putative membrane protein
MRWLPLAALVLAQIGYPLAAGPTRATLVVLTVVLGFAGSVGHAVATRGPRAAAALVAAGAGGGLLVEAAGVAWGFPFGTYQYTDALGPRVLGVPVVVPLAWAWMAWPAWVVARHLTRQRPARIGLAALGLATWDLFLDPQMVAAGYWRWSTVDIPDQNYVGWLAVAVVMMVVLDRAVGPDVADLRTDAPMLALYLWTYVSSVLAHAVFLGLPWSALWGGLGMGLVAVPLGVRIVRR